MKKINIKWNELFKWVKKNNFNSFSRMALCYPINEFSLGITKNPFTIFDNQKNYGNKFGYQKEGIQINFDGNPYNIDFDNEIIYIKDDI